MSTVRAMNRRTAAFVALPAASPRSLRCDTDSSVTCSSARSAFVAGRPLLRQAKPAIVHIATPRATTSAPAGNDGSLVRDGAATVASLGLTIGLEQMAARTLRSSGVQFPGSLCAMLVLLGAITTLRILRLTSAAEKVRDIFTPATAFLTRWLAVFFVPNLVMLPLAPKLPSADVAKILAILVIGLLASILTTALYAVGLRALASKIRGSPAKQVPPAATGGSSGPSNTLLGVLAGGTVAALPFAAAGSGGLAVVSGTIYALCATMLAFCIGQRAPKNVKTVLHPLVVCTGGALAALSLLATLSSVPLATVLGRYYFRTAASFSEWGAGNILAALLGPAVVSFALQMDSRRALVRARGAELIGTSLLATITGLFGTAVAARALAMSPDARLMVVPRMITAPLAAAIVDMLGTQPGVALSVVAVTGLLGANIAMPLLSALKVQDPVVRGLATGAAAHGLGTAAMSDEPAAFPFAAIAMTLVGIFATCFVAYPPIRKILLRAALGRVVPGAPANAAAA